MVTKKAKIAFERGYRVKRGKIINTQTGTVRKLYCGEESTAYPVFSISIKGVACSVKCHLLAAWQKFGNKCIGSKIEVRHLNDNKFNFNLSNIELGSKKQNTEDRKRNNNRKNKK